PPPPLFPYTTLFRSNTSGAALTGEAGATYRTLLILGNGFILTAVLWATALVHIIDGRPAAAALVLALTSLATLCGLVHSPLPSGDRKSTRLNSSHVA